MDNNDLKKELEKIKKAEEPRVCPHCGRCPVCGRKPYEPWDWPKPPIWIWNPDPYYTYESPTNPSWHTY